MLADVLANLRRLHVHRDAECPVCCVLTALDEQAAELARLRAELAHADHALRSLPERAELARLRRVEAHARELLALIDDPQEVCEDEDGESYVSISSLYSDAENLRAALDGSDSDGR
jgi:hypothetical protein